MIAKNEVAGAVTAVVTKNRILHFETTGYADVAAKRPMASNTLFWIASMTKPITGAAILCCRTRGSSTSRIPLRSICQFTRKPLPASPNLTITQMLTHTSGLGEATGPAAQQAKTLADLVPIGSPRR